MPLRFARAGDFHLEEDRYVADAAQCLQWFVADAVRASVDPFVIDGDLTTYKAHETKRCSGTKRWEHWMLSMARNMCACYGGLSTWMGSTR